METKLFLDRFEILVEKRIYYGGNRQKSREYLWDGKILQMCYAKLKTAKGYINYKIARTSFDKKVNNYNDEEIVKIIKKCPAANQHLLSTWIKDVIGREKWEQIRQTPELYEMLFNIA